MPPFWLEQGPGRLSWLTGASAETVTRALEAAPEAPAGIPCRPPAAPTTAGFVAAILDELTAEAIDRYPARLPEASIIDGPGGAAVAAVRALARQRSGSDHDGQFRAALAEQAQTARVDRPPARVPVPPARSDRAGADRRRDARLQLAGYTVLRVTNTQVREDLTATLSLIERLLRSRRERNDHAG